MRFARNRVMIRTPNPRSYKRENVIEFNGRSRRIGGFVQIRPESAGVRRRLRIPPFGQAGQRISNGEIRQRH